MRLSFLKLSLLTAALVAASWSPAARPQAAEPSGPTLQSIGPLTFAPDGTLFAADTEGASIFAIDLGKASSGAAAGAIDVAGIDRKIAAMLGTDASQIVVTDLAVHPKSHNAFVSVMRGTGANAAPALFRVDGAGTINLVSMQGLKFSKVTLPNPPPAAGWDSPFKMDYVKVGPEYVHKNPRVRAITDMAFTEGTLIVAGLSNEEFNSTLRAIPYPFASAAAATDVEIYHGNHKQVETRSPVYAFVPYSINGTPSLVASYLCTPLVTFPLSSIKPGAHIRGTTIAEMGNNNRPLDMVVYRKNGADFILMANNNRGVMKIATAPFATAAPITTPVTTPTGGVPFETIASMKGIEQLDLLDASRAIVMARASGALNLEVLPLP